MKKVVTLLAAGVLFAVWAGGQQAGQKNKPPSSSSPKADQKPDPKPAPTLGFNRAKDFPPLIDSDDILE